MIAPSEIEAFRNVRQYRSRLVQRFYDTLETLTEVGFQIQFDESFPIAMRPEWADLPVEDDANIDVVAIAPTKTALPNGFFDIWLDGIVSITSPSDIEVVLAELETRKTQKAKASGRQRAKKSGNTQKANSAENAPLSVLSPATQKSAAASELTGSTIRQVRKDLRMSQTELAQQIGKSQSWVRDLENKFSDKPISLDYAGKLRQILGL